MQQALHRSSLVPRGFVVENAFSNLTPYRLAKLALTHF
jgi:hypothetical protein